LKLSGALAAQVLAQRVKPSGFILRSNSATEHRGITSNGVNQGNQFVFYFKRLTEQPALEHSRRNKSPRGLLSFIFLTRLIRPTGTQEIILVEDSIQNL